MSFQYRIVDEDGKSSATVFLDGRVVVVDEDSFPDRWDEIRDRIRSKDESVIDIIDAAQALANWFSRLSERITLRNRQFFIDGDPLDNSITAQALRFLDEGLDCEPLLKFIEKTYSNPDVPSRDQLFVFLDKNKFSITEDGDIVTYKGVDRNVEGAEKRYLSRHSGQATVNGEDHNGQIPQDVGDIVEMPRSQVRNDPSDPCSVGLHVAAYGFARSFAGEPTLECHVNPRDVVSVPRDASAQKMRVCRYTVIGEVTEEHSAALVIGKEPKTEPVEEPRPPKAPETHEAHVAYRSESEGKIPGRKTWAKMKGLAKSQRKSIKAVVAIPSRGWVLIEGGDQNKREDWRVPPKKSKK